MHSLEIKHTVHSKIQWNISFIHTFLCSLNGPSKKQQQKNQLQYYENSLKRAFNVFARISKIVLCHGAQCETLLYINENSFKSEKILMLKKYLK